MTSPPTPQSPRTTAPLWHQLAAGLVLYLILVVTLLVYWPGLSGMFMFDDMPNLEPMSNIGYPPTFAGILHFVATGLANPLGRPIALATFLLHDTVWPTAPRPFLLTNLYIHVLNGALVYWFTLLLSRRLTSSFLAAMTIASITAALWLLHPLNVSTTLYVIQRMTELAATFSLLALIGFVYGRTLVLERPVTGYLIMSASIGIGGILGVLSKENAILLPLFVLATEYLLRLRGAVDQPRYWWPWSAVFLMAPIALLVLWMGLGFDRILSGYENRAFSLGERLLTETRVIWTYLRYIFIPRQAGSTLYYDDYPISTGVLDPPTTLLSIVGLALLACTAVATRRKAPVVTFAICWFLGGHLLESTVWPLEIYFEHRNYMPMMGPVFAIAYYAVRATDRLRRVTLPAVIAIVAAFSFLTWQEAKLWGNPMVLAHVWAEERPASPRSQQLAANMWLQRGDAFRARQIMADLTQRAPEHTSGWVQVYLLDCMLGVSALDHDYDILLDRLNTGGPDNAVVATLQRLVEMLGDGTCPDLTPVHLLTMTNALLMNEDFSRRRSARAGLHYVRAQTYGLAGAVDATIADLQASFDHRPRVEVALNEARVLASHGRFTEALQAVEKARSADTTRLPVAASVHASEIAELERVIREDIEAQ